MLDPEDSGQFKFPDVYAGISNYEVEVEVFLRSILRFVESSVSVLSGQMTVFKPDFVSLLADKLEIDTESSEFPEQEAFAIF